MTQPHKTLRENPRALQSPGTSGNIAEAFLLVRYPEGNLAALDAGRQFERDPREQASWNKKSYPTNGEAPHPEKGVGAFVFEKPSSGYFRLAK